MFFFWFLSICSIPIADASVQQNDFLKLSRSGYTVPFFVPLSATPAAN
jgi:hypothetical protein